MEQNLLKKNLWNTAGKAGLILGVTSAAFMFLSQWLSQGSVPALLNSILSFVIWAVKFIGCIWIMRFFMKSFVQQNPEADNSASFRMGTAAALLSAVVYAAFSFANVAFISADFFAGQMDAVLQQMAPMMDSNTLSQVDKTMENLPQITFISNLIYCFLYGTVLALILSRNIPSKDPFADYKPDEQ